MRVITHSSQGLEWGTLYFLGNDKAGQRLGFLPCDFWERLGFFRWLWGVYGDDGVWVGVWAACFYGDGRQQFGLPGGFGDAVYTVSAFGYSDQKVLCVETFAFGRADAGIAARGYLDTGLCSVEPDRHLVSRCGFDCEFVRRGSGKTTSQRSNRLRGIQSALPQ